jgi:hypothetical protein
LAHKNRKKRFEYDENFWRSRSQMVAENEFAQRARWAPALAKIDS